MLLDIPQNLPRKTTAALQKPKKTFEPVKRMKENCETLRRIKKRGGEGIRRKIIAKKALATMTTQSKTLEKSSISEESVERLDCGDGQLPNVFYIEKLLENYKKLEHNFSPSDCLKNHNIDFSSRGKMVDWMIEVLFSLQCSEDTFFLSVSLMDRYLASSSNFSIKDLHLIGVVCMFIASKYEDVFAIKLETIHAKVAHAKFPKEAIKAKELEILETLDFQVFGPTLNKILALPINKMIIMGVLESQDLSLFEKAINYFGKMVLYDYGLVAKHGLMELVAGVIYSGLKLIETICGNIDFYSKVSVCNEILGVETSVMADISNQIFLLTQTFDQLFPNNNLKKVSVDFYLEMKEKRKK